MIRSETMEINGRRLVKTYSDAGLMVERNGVLYDSAIDPEDSGRVYSESAIKIPEEITIAY